MQEKRGIDRSMQRDIGGLNSLSSLRQTTGPECSAHSVSCGARAHAQIPAVDLKSTRLATRAN